MGARRSRRATAGPGCVAVCGVVGPAIGAGTSGVGVAVVIGTSLGDGCG